MAFAVTNTFAGQTTLVAADLDQNFTDIENKINGNLDSSNLTANAAISNSQLAYPRYEIVLCMSLHGTELNQAVTADLIIGSVPYYGVEAVYNIVAIEHMFMLDTGAGITNLIGTLKYGNSTDGFTAIKTNIDIGAADNVAFWAPTVTTITTSSTRPKFFVFDVTQAGVGYAAGDSACLSVMLTRDLR